MIDRPVALITGASGDIGRAIAVALAAQGAAVVGSGRRPEGLEQLQAALPSGTPCAVISQDVTADRAPDEAVELALARFGRLDFLVNNAGIGKPKAVHETADEEFDAFIDVHLRATFRFCRAALGAFRGDASIVNIASTYAVIGGMRGGAYSAAKAGVVGLTLHLAAQYGAQGVRSNVIAPGVIQTAMTEYAWQTERFRRMNFEMTPSNRTGRSEDVAGITAFLCSAAGAFINGQVIAVDGGWSATKYLSAEALDARRIDDP